MEKEKIVLPKELQKDMLKFFLKTSIPKIKKQRLLSETEKIDERNEKNEEKERN